jgi:gliding motility-associated-like protein
VIVSGTGGVAGKIYLNDLLNDDVISGTLIPKITLTILDKDGITGLTIDATGNVNVPPGVPSGIYEITYQICETANPNNCDTAVITIQVYTEPIVVPEGISPQGDGKNDKWRIRGLVNYPKHEVMVYNRWGNMVFRASPYNNDWDGKSSNSLTVGGDNRVPAGTYYWVINLGNGETLAGYLYIVY